MPASLDELQLFNMNDIFRGYNLKFNIQNAPTFAKLKETIKKVNNTEKIQSGLKSCQVEHH
jgi:hypothetical protein